MYTVVQPEKHATQPTDEEIEALSRLGGQLVTLGRDGPAAVKDALPTCDAILCAAFEVDREIIERAARLRIVARLGTGVDNIDVAAATDLGVPVTNVPGFATTDVAEHTIALLFACAKKIRTLDDAVKSGKWEMRNNVRLGAVDGKTLGLVGFGAIGRAVAKYAAGLGMRVAAYDPLVSPEDIVRGGAEPIDNLDALLECADYVSLHAPLTSETEQMISRRELALMKPDAFLINCGRGSLVDEAALVEAVESGTIAGAGLDVLESEPPAPDSPALRCPNIVITPHCSAHTERALYNLRRPAVNSILQALKGQWPDNVINPDVRARWEKRLAGLSSA